MAKSVVLDTILHRYLRIPYTLNVQQFRAPKKPRATFVLIHGIGNTLHSWDELVEQLPKDVRIIGVDLLGFGKSPKPHWAMYNAKTQARSVGMTLLKLGLSQRPIIVGHSLGGLVAVEVACRYPLYAKQLVLCSPPIYGEDAPVEGFVKSRDAVLRELYKTIKKYPNQLEQAAPLAVKLGLANRSLTINQENIAFYMAALESSIINQTSYNDALRLTMPVTIMYGTLDPFVIGANINKIAKDKPNITVKKYIFGHEIIGAYVRQLSRYLSELAKAD